MVGSRTQGGVAHSAASKIPWQKRIQGTAIQSGGGSGMLRYGLKKKMLKNQRGGFSRVIARMERGKKKPQKGGFLKSLERSMFGVKRTRGKRKREPAVIHSSARSYPQKGGFYGRSPQRDVDKFHAWFGRTGRKVAQKGGVLGLDRFSSYYKGKSKKEQQEMDNWAARNL
jgi:hypothetical protein